jgi:hypothetical protein
VVRLMPWILGIVIASAILLIVAAFLITYENRDSRNLALALSALIGAIVLFWIQLFFELKSTITYSSTITAQFTVDRGVVPDAPINSPLDVATQSRLARAIRQWPAPIVIERNAVETEASIWLATHAPQHFHFRKGKAYDSDLYSWLVDDFTIFSIINFIATQEPDWQLKRIEHKGTGQTLLLSRPSEYTAVTVEEVSSSLQRVGNLFSGAPMHWLPPAIRLPPQSKMVISGGSLLITNPVCQMSFRVRTVGQNFWFDPDDTRTEPHALHQKNYKDGYPQFITVTVGIDVEVRFFALVAQNPDQERYRAWTSRVTNDLQKWWEFEEVNH